MSKKTPQSSSARKRAGSKEGWLRRLRIRFRPLSARDLALGLATAAFLTFLLAGFEFQRLPDYQAGDIADRTIKALHDFTVEDTLATAEKRQRAARNVSVVFDLDLRVNERLAEELRNGFQRGREILRKAEEERSSVPAQKRLLLQRLKRELPAFDQGAAIEVLMTHGFDPDLQQAMAALLKEALAYPGVVLTRDLLQRYQDRGILLMNSVTSQTRPLKDLAQVQDLQEARKALGQQQSGLKGLDPRQRGELLDLLRSWLVPNLIFNETATRLAETAAQMEVAPVLMQVKKGRAIVRAGDEVTPQAGMLLSALQQSKDPLRQAARVIGIFILVAFFQMALWRYLEMPERRLKPQVGYFLLVNLVMAGTALLTKVMLGVADLVAAGIRLPQLQDPVMLHLLVPFALGAFLLVLLVSVNITLIYSMIFSVLVALMTGDPRTFVYSLAGCLAAAYVLHNYRQRAALVKAGFVIGCVNALTAVALQLYVGTLDGTTLLWAAGLGLAGGLLAATAASLLLPLLEQLFGITTDIRLLELSNLNTPILRRLAVEAPGTYHHSIIVGTLAEEAAEAVDANSLLTRVGAYYHDIGKLSKPEYYVENQIYCGNKHESLTPSMSSLILANHVKEGLALADEIKLAGEVRDLIPQHHGTRLMSFFYRKAVEEAGGDETQVTEETFRYPGPKPQSKEAAILMTADQVEAAARTLQDPSGGQVRGMIRRIIRSDIEDGQFDECDITVRELSRVASAYERVILRMHHQRIEYPGYEFSKDSGKQPPLASPRVQ
ncbi:MAG TPA: HDIG domain-containing protein [Acidobacteriota bacterium]|nr:HDIG domain-containing protein [Acidobacteriota bacterium]